MLKAIDKAIKKYGDGTKAIIVGGIPSQAHQSNERVFSDRGREGLFLRAFGKRNIR